MAAEAGGEEARATRRAPDGSARVGRPADAARRALAAPRTRSRESSRPARSSCDCARASPSSSSRRRLPTGRRATRRRPRVLRAEPDEGATARINLRLPEHLKAGIEQAAGRERMSVNTWLVRTAAAALAHGRPRHGRAAAASARPTPAGCDDRVLHLPGEHRDADLRNPRTHLRHDRARRWATSTSAPATVTPPSSMSTRAIRPTADDVKAAELARVEYANEQLLVKVPKLLDRGARTRRDLNERQPYVQRCRGHCRGGLSERLRERRLRTPMRVESSALPAARARVRDCRGARGADAARHRGSTLAGVASRQRTAEADRGARSAEQAC